jgi:hypothetical protein
VDVDALVAPFVVWVEGSANGKGVKLYSTISNPGTVNVTPVTNAIVATALNSDPEEYFETGLPAPPSDADIELAKQALFDLLESAFDTLGMPEDFDLMNGEFIANGTGFDQFLDSVSFPVDDDSIEIVDNSTGTTLYEEVLSTGVVIEEKTPEEVDDIIASSLSLLEQIETDMVDFEDLYADEIPTLTELQNILGPIMAATFLNDGYNADDTLVNMSLGKSGPPPGFEILGISIHRAMQAQFFTIGDTPVQIDEKRGNFTGVWAILRIGLGNQTGDVITSYVQETQGGEWKWNGNQCPFSNGGNINAQADRWIRSVGTEVYSGLDVIIEDEGNLAKDDFGIMGAVILNSALPTIGQTIHYGLIVARPEEIIAKYEITNSPDPLCNENSQYYESCGLNIEAIDDMEFVYIGYDENDDPQLVWIDLLESKPIKESTLSSNPNQYFPIVNTVADKSPTSQFSINDFQNSVSITFTPVSGYSMGNARLNLEDGVNVYQLTTENPTEGDTSWSSTTFDTSSTTVWPPTNVWVSVWYNGAHNREFSSYYILDLQ